MKSGFFVWGDAYRRVLIDVNYCSALGNFQSQ